MNRFNVYKIEKSEAFIPLTLDLFSKNVDNVYELQQDCSTIKSVLLYLGQKSHLLQYYNIIGTRKNNSIKDN